jgi:hypothetical protein
MALYIYEKDQYPSPQLNGLGLLELNCSLLGHNWLQLEHLWLPVYYWDTTGTPLVTCLLLGQSGYNWNTYGL